MQRNLMPNAPKGYAQITPDAATALAPPAGTIIALVVSEGQAVRFRDDAIDPTTTVGFPLAVGQILQLEQIDLTKVKFINQVAGGKLNILYYGGLNA